MSPNEPIWYETHKSYEAPMTTDTAPTPQEPSSISGGGDSVPALLNQWEQKAVLDDLMGLECLINYHDCQEAGADAMEPGWGAGNARRALELLALGREIIARDPELWTDEQKKPFALRHSERVSLTPTGEAAP